MTTDVQEYQEERGKGPFGRWFKGLNAPAAAKIMAVLEKLANGDLSNVKSLGEGVFEYRLDWGPGYRVYFGKDGEKLIILVGGGHKKGQASDIKAARGHWTNYKKQKIALEENKKHGTDKRLP